MAEGEVIKEFLVALGFNVNEGQQRRFNEGLKKAQAEVLKLGAAFTGLTVAMVTGVYRTARSMEDLYYSSQRANSAAGNMQAFGFAVGQMGGNAEAAKKSVENLAHFIRTVPGAQGMINQFLGRDAKAELGDTVKLMQDLGAKFRGMPYPQAYIHAQLFGIDEDTLRALIQGVEDWSGKASRAYRLFGVNQERLADDSKDFMNTLRELWNTMDAVWERLTQSTLPGAENQIHRLIKVIQDNAAPIGAVLDGIANGFLNITNRVVGQVEELPRWMEQQRKYLNEQLEWLKGGLAALGVKFDDNKDSIEQWKSSMSGFEPRSFLDKLASLRKGLFDYLNGLDDWIAEKTGIYWLGSEQYRKDHQGNGAGGQKPGSGSDQGWMDWLRSKWRDFTGQGTPSGDAGARGQQALDYFVSQGWTQEQAAGIVAGLQHESNFNPSAVGDGGKAYGVAQWHPDRQAAFQQWLGKDIRQSTYEEQLAFVHYEMTQGKERAAGDRLRTAQTAPEAGAIFRRYYERPADVDGEAIKTGQTAQAWMNRQNEPAYQSNVVALLETMRNNPEALSRAAANANQVTSSGPSLIPQAAAATVSNTGPTISQQTNITVNGATDAQRTADEVAGRQGDVNQRLVRSAVGGVR